MITANVDTSKLNLAMAKFAKETRKGLEEVIELQTRSILTNLIAITPPGKRRGGDFLNKKGFISSAANKNAKIKIASDVAKLFPTTAIKDEKRILGMIERGHKWRHTKSPKAVGSFANSMGELRRVHEQGRNPKTGRVKINNSSQRMAVTRKALRNQLVKELQLNVGILNAGWRRAFNRLRPVSSSMPAWIKRHGAKPGDVDFKKTRHGLTIIVSNKVGYYPKDSIARINQAVSKTQRGIEKQIEKMAASKAAKASARMKR